MPWKHPSSTCCIIRRWGSDPTGRHIYADVVGGAHGRYLAERIPGSELTILTAGHFAWEEIPDQFAAMVAEWAAAHAA